MADTGRTVFADGLWADGFWAAGFWSSGTAGTDTGRTVFADGLWSDNFWATGLWAADAGVTVPDVIGKNQAQATTDIETVGLVVSVVTAYSSTVLAGTVISQEPAGGSSVAPGSTVTITVSLGGDSQNSGGYSSFYDDYERLWRQRRKRLKEQQEEDEAIQDKIEREIAQLLHEQERKDAQQRELNRLSELLNKYKSEPVSSPRVSEALQAAEAQLTFARMEKLQREMERMWEEEEFVLLLLMQ